MKTKGKNIKAWVIPIGCILVMLPICWILLIRLEGGEPQVTFELPSTFLGMSQEVSISLSDAKSGLRKIRLDLLRDKKEIVLLEKDFPAGGIFGGGKVYNADFKIPIVPKKLKISDGKAILRMVVTDRSWRRWWHGNMTYIEREAVIDTKRPDIEILSRAHNVSQGGAGLVIYRLSESCKTSGVSVGENFFPGHPGFFKDNKIFMAFFALNYNQGRRTNMIITAIDLAGNSARGGFPYYIKNKSFRKDVLRISDRFLNWKLPEFDTFLDQFPKTSPLEKFLKVNRELRQENYKTIVEVGNKTDKRLYWDVAFLRLPKSARQAGFADHRDYQYKGRVVDRQVHFGVDLASIEHSPVPAANGGKVVFAEKLGIYGKTIIIDHGFGLFSMYSHLSSFTVEIGKIVSKGEQIGHTGITGLAGGDHLHFGMLIYNTFVNPIEWWDAAWIENNISSKIRAVKSRLGE